MSVTYSDVVDPAARLERVREPRSSAGNQPASVAGKSSSDEAKIGGMTPDGVHLEREVRRLAAVQLPAHDALRVLDRDAALAALDEDDGADHHHHDRRRGSTMPSSLIWRAGRPERLEGAPDRRRDARHDAGEDDERDAVADAALGDLLAHPHDERGAGGEGDHGEEPEAPARLARPPTRPAGSRSVSR